MRADLDPFLSLACVACLSLGHARAIALAACFRRPPADDDRVLVLGRISDDPKAHYEQLKPLLDYVVPRMADVGIREGRILMARDAQQMASYLRRGPRRLGHRNRRHGDAAATSAPAPSRCC